MINYYKRVSLHINEYSWVLMIIDSYSWLYMLYSGTWEDTSTHREQDLVKTDSIPGSIQCIGALFLA